MCVFGTGLLQCLVDDRMIGEPDWVEGLAVLVGGVVW